MPPPLLASSPPAPPAAAADKQQQQQAAANSPAYSDISDDGEDSGSRNSSKEQQQQQLKLSVSNLSASSVPPATATAPHGSSQAAAAAGLLGPPPDPRPLPPTPHLVRTSSGSPSPRTPGSIGIPADAMSSSGAAPPVIRASTPSSSVGPLHLPPAAMARPPMSSAPSVTNSLSTASSSGSLLSAAAASLLHAPGPQPGTPEYHKYLAANGFPPFPYPYPVGMDPNYHIQLLKTDPVYKANWDKDRGEREKAFKAQLDQDQGRYSGLSLVKEATGGGGGGGMTSSAEQHHQRSSLHHQSAGGHMRKPEGSSCSGMGIINNKAEDLRKREPSGGSTNIGGGGGNNNTSMGSGGGGGGPGMPMDHHRRPSSRASPGTISVKAEFREKDGDPMMSSSLSMMKREVKAEVDGGIKPTMETRGPPPGPQTFGYMHPHHPHHPPHPGLVPRPPYSLHGLVPPHQFDPLFVTAGSLGGYGLPPHHHSPYLSPAHLAGVRPPFSFADHAALLRAPSFPGLGSATADELVRAAGSPGLSGTKALDLLQQHASQYYANQVKEPPRLVVPQAKTPGLRIRTHLIRFRIQIQSGFRIQGFDDQKLKKNYS